jgi:hypothetical protein
MARLEIARAPMLAQMNGHRARAMLAKEKFPALQRQNGT